jgi:hypothetical protein
MSQSSPAARLCHFKPSVTFLLSPVFQTHESDGHDQNYGPHCLPNHMDTYAYIPTCTVHIFQIVFPTILNKFRIIYFFVPQNQT